MIEAGRTGLLTVLAGLSCCAAHSQEGGPADPSQAGAGEAGPSQADPSQAEPGQAEPDPAGHDAAVEEVIVRGRSRARLRQEIELATDAIYDRFNEINSTDEFDIHCRNVRITGSKIPRRICRANFWRAAEARASGETVRSLQGSSAVSATVFLGEALYKHELLSEEMRRLVAEDDELRRATIRLGELKQITDEGRLSRNVSAASSSRVVTAEDEELPYDAQIMADVQIGRDSWKHRLTYRTFAIAHLSGDIDAVGVECDHGSERLEYELDAEWTLPDDWGHCEVVVDSPFGTTFILFEFE
jgi:hypothetical protein